jgi:hypothetical protein
MALTQFGVVSSRDVVRAPGADQIRLSKDGSQLIWSVHLVNQNEDDMRELRTTPKALTAFLNLNSAEEVLRYARKYGVLGMCEHGLPPFHTKEKDDLRADYARCNWGITRDGIVEPIATWLALSKQCRAMLQLGSELNAVARGKYLDSHFWRYWRDAMWLEGQHRRVEAMRLTAKTNEGFRYCGYGQLNSALEDWLRCGNVLPRLLLRPGEPALFSLSAHLGGMPNLFGVLGLMMAFELGKGDGWTMCAECGSTIRCSKNVALGRRQFCEPCRAAGKPGLHATRAYRLNIRKGRRGRAS